MTDNNADLLAELERAIWSNPPATTNNEKNINSPTTIVSYGLQALLGAFVGVFLVSITSVALIEITFSPVFSVLLGLLFEALAVCLFYRCFSIPRGETNLLTRLYVALFSTIVLVAGCMCIFIDGYLPEYQPFWKTVVYGWLSTACLFILTFGIMDLAYAGMFQFCSACCCSDPRVDAQQQRSHAHQQMVKQRTSVMSYPMIVLMIGAVNAVFGGLYGLLFGPLELIGNLVSEDRSEMFSSQYLMIPVGVVCGSLFAVACHYTRLRIDRLSLDRKRRTVADKVSEDLEGLSVDMMNNVVSVLSQGNMPLFSQSDAGI